MRSMEMNEFWGYLLAAVIGYLIGSLSFARIVTWIFARGTDISSIQQPIPNTDITFESDSISASAVRIHVGTRYGCLTAILDIMKVTLPTLAFRFWQPEMPFFLVTAAAGLVGHDWPIYYRFKGGRGESPILGGMLAIDPLGLVVTNMAGFIIGWLVGDVLVLRWSFLVLLIPWFWLTKQEPAYVLYAVFFNLVYWSSMSPELKQFVMILKKGGLSNQSEVAGDMAMGKRLGSFLDQYGAPALLKKGFKRDT